MRLIRKRRVKARKKLDLRVDVLQGKDLVLSDVPSTVMVAGVALNKSSKHTKKLKRTANPTWNESFRFPLRLYDTGDVLHIAIIDKHKRYANYLGELRLSLTEIFEDLDKSTSRHDGKQTLKMHPRWFKLRSSSLHNKFVTGSVQISLEIMCKSDVSQRYNLWKQSLVKQKSININDQDFYSDHDDDSESETDVESLMIDQEDKEMEDRLSAPIAGLQLAGNSSSSSSFLQLPVPVHRNESTSSLSDAQFDMQSRPLMSKTSSSTSSTALNRLPCRQRATNILGVVFLEIQSASDLPPYKTRLQKKFDMDPFVVISLGRKTFRTSWRKHTLEPVFNQKLALEVVSHEQNFDLMFTILDKDRISFHDNVAEGFISLKEVMNTDEEKDYNLKMKLHRPELEGKYDPHLRLKVHFKSYATLQKELWNIILSKYGSSFGLIEIEQLLEDTQIDEDFNSFFQANHKTLEDTLTTQEMLKVLNNRAVHLTRCPLCRKKRYTELVTHVAICSSKVNKLRTFASTSMASKRWYSKVLIKMVYGKYALGKNNANILVQDRETGFIMEEKMALYIRLGIRMLYKGKGADSRRIKNVLKNMSVKQGAKFDNSPSVKDIEPFIKFYKLDLSECEDPSNWKTFNQFFYRKLKPGMRPAESDDERIITSPADCRCTTFNHIETAQSIWIKGRSFTIKKLLGSAYTPEFENCAIGIFRLAPQDYHRFHCPVDGVIGDSIEISGEYYTVNPMAIRSDLDVYGENVRVVTEINTEKFGKVMFVAVGAMMVGSTVMTVKKGDTVSRTDELGYFKFGGSTVLVLFQQGVMEFDSDLIQNSDECVETLVRVGMSVGHHVEIDELERKKIDFKDEPEEMKLKIIRTITGGNTDTRPWEYYNIDVQSDDEFDDEDAEEEEEEGDESERI